MALAFFESIDDAGISRSIRVVHKPSILSAEQQAAGLPVTTWPPIPEPTAIIGKSFRLLRDTFAAEWRYEAVFVPITIFQFRNLFTLDEKVAIKITPLASVDRAILDSIMDDLSSATEVDLSNVQLIQSMDFLVAKEILTPARRDEILGVV